MFTTTISAARTADPVRTTVRVRRPAHAPLRVALATVHVLDGGAPHGALTGPARHALEQHAGLTSAQRLDLSFPTALPRAYTQAQARRLADALTAAGATVALTDTASPV
ncbi:hypothetical protein IGS67_08245 [Flavimobilis sp. GY10621]|uniref:Uncharacterized protein n=1 Tax=Flavimobilis rhizosphaerae TaxID=2775421 RepID=A0ABR9DR68_9MICO|nr:hypothetical protein [Flavimobilis rhizosphaerae]MBD9699478.1 hypothetical protein [Flavimobilis rhizosphaerae]